MSRIAKALANLASTAAILGTTMFAILGAGLLTVPTEAQNLGQDHVHATPASDSVLARIQDHLTPKNA
jgi:hypothetical protein